MKLPTGVTEFDPRDLGRWSPSVTGFRDAIQAGRVMQPASGDDLKAYAASEREVSMVVTMALEAVRAGRVIDLGMLPNEVIGECGRRGGYLWDQDALAQPFAEPWIFCHAWTMKDGSPDGSTALYVVNPVRDGVEIVELQPCTVRGAHALMIHDRAILFHAGEDSDPRRYRCQAMPSPLRFLVPPGDPYNNGREPYHAASANVLDPLMAALLLVNTDGVRRERITPAEKLNKARARARKPPIAPHERIDSRLYVTAIMARLNPAKRAPGGGHHASPIPHVRRGHYRTYESGQRSFIRDTLVAVTPEARASFVAKRSHYEVRS